MKEHITNTELSLIRRLQDKDSEIYKLKYELSHFKFLGIALAVGFAIQTLIILCT